MRAKMARHQIGFFPENGNKGLQNTRSIVFAIIKVFVQGEMNFLLH